MAVPRDKTGDSARRTVGVYDRPAQRSTGSALAVRIGIGVAVVASILGLLFLYWG